LLFYCDEAWVPNISKIELTIWEMLSIGAVAVDFLLNKSVQQVFTIITYSYQNKFDSQNIDASSARTLPRHLLFKGTAF